MLAAAPSKEQADDIDFLLNLGELFTLVAYGQLLIEKAKIDAVDDDVVDQMFDFMVRGFFEVRIAAVLKNLGHRGADGPVSANDQEAGEGH